MDVDLDFAADCKLLHDPDSLPVYPGSMLLGGVEPDEHSVLAIIRKKFCNDHLFDEKPVLLTPEQLEEKKFKLLKEMAQLIGAQVRKDCEPTLLRIINGFCAQGDEETQGREMRVETPFFSVVCYVFPNKAAQDGEHSSVIYIGWARWATDVC